jgi:two-component system sensor histidine kinase QseC
MSSDLAPPGTRPWSLQRRLLVYLLLCAPLVLAAAALSSMDRARHEVNELFDTEIIRLARQVQATLVGVGSLAAEPTAARESGEADLEDLAIAVWDRQGQLLLVDREGVSLPRRPDASGFVDLVVADDTWRVYYLQSPRGEWLVAAGQRVYERDELVWNLVASQLLPWLLVLPVLLVAMAWAVRQALEPVRALTAELGARSADDLRPLSASQAPSELQPLLTEMNGLFTRIDQTLARERRFTADAAHELRTPLAALRAQWDVVRGASDLQERQQAEGRLAAGLDRLDRLVTQMLAMARLETTQTLPQSTPVPWPALVEQVMSDLLPLAARRGIELECEWPEAGARPDWRGDPDLLTVLLRNLMDNAVRYAPPGSTVQLRFGADHVQVVNAGPPLSEAVRRHLGERFRRQDGQTESGSGLGVSIAMRVAALHGLTLAYGAGADGQGVVAELRPGARPA